MRVVIVVMVVMVVMVMAEDYKEEEDEEEEEVVDVVVKEEERIGVEDEALEKKTSKEGRLQYELLAREAQMPSYGSCYQAALQELKEGCGRINEEVQSRLALSFTNCYLARFGWSTYPCGPDEPIHTCMSHLDLRATALYSSLLTSTLAMCHFLEAQSWRKSTTHAVMSLKETSHQVTSQLDVALASAASLKKQMEAQLYESRQALTSAFKEIRESAEEQRHLVESIFSRVGQLHSLVMGEFSGINAVVFYVVGVMISVIVTCGVRTGTARLPLLLLLSASFALERVVAVFILTYIDTDSQQENIEFSVQVLRRLAATFALLMVVFSALSYRDPVAAATARIDELLAVTKEIMTFFGLGGYKEAAVFPVYLKGMYDHSDSSDDTYNPNEDSDLEECLSLLNGATSASNERKQYSLRPRKLFHPNPITEMESPTLFAMLMARQESLSRRKGRHIISSIVNES